MPQGLWLGKLDRAGTTHGTGNRGWESLGRRMSLVLFMGSLKYLWVTNWGCAGAVGI